MTRDELAGLIQPAIYGAICDYTASRTRFGVSLEAALAAADEILFKTDDDAPVMDGAQ